VIVKPLSLADNYNAITPQNISTNEKSKHYVITHRTERNTIIQKRTYLVTSFLVTLQEFCHFSQVVQWCLSFSFSGSLFLWIILLLNLVTPKTLLRKGNRLSMKHFENCTNEKKNLVQYAAIRQTGKKWNSRCREPFLLRSLARTLGYHHRVRCLHIWPFSSHLRAWKSQNNKSINWTP